ncbi:MAG: hypothetical protein COA78_25250 [Blastopirellula sp.]|nr:MAG: hypothetical protein COA78_25250 [Blastopirellula sp.]
MTPANTMIIREKATKKAVAELSIDLVSSRTLNSKYEAVSVLQHLGEMNILGSQARAAACL